MTQDTTHTSDRDFDEYADDCATGAQFDVLNDGSLNHYITTADDRASDAEYDGYVDDVLTGDRADDLQIMEAL